MLAGIGFFMFRIARREKENFDPELSDDYVPHGVRHADILIQRFEFHHYESFQISRHPGKLLRPRRSG